MNDEILMRIVQSLDRIGDELAAMRYEQKALISESKEKANTDMKTYVDMMQSILQNKKQ